MTDIGYESTDCNYTHINSSASQSDYCTHIQHCGSSKLKSNMAVPGVLMRMAEPRDATQSVPDQSIAPPAAPCPGVEAVHILAENDSQSPSQNTVYYLSDITPIASSSSAYDEDVRANGDHSNISWVICAFINGRDPSQSTPESLPTSPHLLPMPPVPNSVLVINGSTPRPDKEGEYHAWYDQEHGQKLTLVPGWNASRRYRLEKVYGDAKTANFYGFNYYDEKNGLGGTEWKAGVTEWTMRFRENAARPNLRRVWRVVRTGAP